MCGIAGIVRLDGAAVDAACLQRMTHALRHRGPDGEGHWTSPRGEVGLGHRRLAIIDLSPAAAQPMTCGGRYTVTYNGEIYNYRELRDDLTRLGHRFSTASDTEVLLAAYAQFGPDCLRRLDGMFAFALWDEQERILFCARDRFGEKPLFYHYQPGRLFVFASEMKALFASGVPRAMDRRMLFHYLAHDVVELPFERQQTFYQGVRRLPAAHSMTLPAGGAPTYARYWALPAGPPSSALSLDDAAVRFRQLLTESVRIRLRSDVPVGTSLSGGMDSSSIVCLIRELRAGGQQTFSARFDDPALDEGPHIERVAAHAGVQTHFVWPSAEELAREIDALLRHQEEPVGSASPFAQWSVMRLAKEQGVTVLLDGQGADELLAGYLFYFRSFLAGLVYSSPWRFLHERRAYRRLRGRPLALGWRFGAEALSPELLRWAGRWRRQRRRVAAFADVHPDLAREFAGEDPPFATFRDLGEALRFSLENYGLEKLLRAADRNSMAFSREVRLPFLSPALVEFTFSLPSSYKLAEGWNKYLLRRAMEPVLPREIAWRVDKLGFRPPQEAWLAHPAVAPLIVEARAHLVREGLLGAPRADRAFRYLALSRLLRLESLG